MHIRVICDCKTRDRRLLALQEDYEARISHFGAIGIEELAATRNRRTRSEALSVPERQLLEKLRGSRWVLLDARGEEWTSDQFATWMTRCAAQGSRELVFIVGGPDGFSPAFRSQAGLRLALSRMTLTRDWARTLLLEQIYRAYTIERGFPYAR
jgi:23S rRNA (pseudouridine1915-N3)-methyltransferase